MAKVTVSIRTLDRPTVVRTAIDSVLANEHASRVVVSVNAPSPQFAEQYDELARQYASRVTFVFRDVRLRPEDHFAAVVSEVETEYVALLADDDWYAPGFIDRAVRQAEATGAGLVFGPYTVIRHDGEVRVDRNYASRFALVRALKYVSRNEDGCVYGLYRTSVLKRNLQYLDTFTVRGVRTPLHAVYPFLLAVILDGGYASVGSGEGPVWFNDERTTKHELYVRSQSRSALTSFAEISLTKLGRHRRYVSVARQKLGLLASMIVSVASGVRLGLEILWASRGVLAAIRRRMR